MEKSDLQGDQKQGKGKKTAQSHEPRQERRICIIIIHKEGKEK